MNVTLVKVVRNPMGAPFKRNRKDCDEIFSKASYICQTFEYLCLTFLNFLFLHTGVTRSSLLY